MRQYDVIKLNLNFYHCKGGAESGYLIISVKTTDPIFLEELIRTLENCSFPIQPDIQKKVGKYKGYIRYNTNSENHFPSTWDEEEFLWDVLNKIVHKGWIPYAFRNKDSEIYLRRTSDGQSKGEGPEPFDIDIREDIA